MLRYSDAPRETEYRAVVPGSVHPNRGWARDDAVPDPVGRTPSNLAELYAVWYSSAVAKHPKLPNDEPAKNPHAVALGQLGGRRRVPKGTSKLTPAERSARARKAALARWGKSPTDSVK